jgi:hypothetical protein
MQSIAPEVDVTAESLSQALAQTHVRLHRSLQKTAAEAGFEYKLELRLASEAESLGSGDDGMRSLTVVALERSDHASQGVVQGRIRFSNNPVLVACVD